jgi:hypothetical protein
MDTTPTPIPNPFNTPVPEGFGLCRAYRRSEAQFPDLRDRVEAEIQACLGLMGNRPYPIAFDQFTDDEADAMTTRRGPAPRTYPFHVLNDQHRLAWDAVSACFADRVMVGADVWREFAINSWLTTLNSRRTERQRVEYLERKVRLSAETIMRMQGRIANLKAARARDRANVSGLLAAVVHAPEQCPQHFTVDLIPHGLIPRVTTWTRKGIGVEHHASGDTLSLGNGQELAFPCGCTVVLSVVEGARG